MVKDRLGASCGNASIYVSGLTKKSILAFGEF